MQLPIKKINLPDPELFIRRCGYALLRDRNGNIKSFAKRFHGELFPRFHLYLEENSDSWLLNLHLDQKAPVYAGVTAHSGDYDGPVVEQEIARIQALLPHT
jgi:hypothetical protein